MSETGSMPEKAVVQFDCHGQAVGKMRNEMDVRMVKPFEERFELATDEGAFHGGDASAPPPLAMFVGALTGCIMTQIRAFAKRLGVSLSDLKVETRVQWNWQAVGRVYETAPRAFDIDVLIDSPDPEDKVVELIETAKKGCFIEQTLGVSNTINHRMKTADGWRTV
ncbi:OsmC family protein [Hoeflea prorocentri]|uniref:OsmC family protein n=1 Tax=Hoeflea prorocentri TaxID=1922333 RepID=A0A9X3ZIP6_9HYPH|nr:OsmC family protein [Hoeflea prorocentri]MCY6382664.1 OsmC family protein [Hoeflea prorocentri]MDA5400464.1 OsmC family protein [Hoeflea prorocentri]